MVEKMNFPETFDEFIKQYSFIDDEKIYTNGSELIQVFRIKQWEEHQKEENEILKKQLENCYCNRTDCSGRIKDSKQYDSLVQKIENQQKEFVKYLEEEINKIEKVQVSSLEEITGKDYIIKLKREILAKYKEIIGENND